MKVKILRPHLGDRGTIHEVGEVLEVSELRAREMERNNLAAPLVTARNIETLGGGKGVADKSAPRPIPTAPIGGQIGEAKPASSSPADQAPPKTKSRSKRRKGKQESLL